MNYVVCLTNFGTVLYNGPNSVLSMDKAEASGFQCTVTVTKGNEIVRTLSWCPISRWSWYG